MKLQSWSLACVWGLIIQCSAMLYCELVGGTVPSLSWYNGCLFKQNKPLLQYYVSVQPPEPKHTNVGHGMCAGWIQSPHLLLKQKTSSCGVKSEDWENFAFFNLVALVCHLDSCYTWFTQAEYLCEHSADVHDSQMMYPANFGDLLTFVLVPPLVWHFWCLVKYFGNYKRNCCEI